MSQEIHRVMHEIKRRRLEVLRVTDITPRMRRITVGGPELEGFLSQGADDHIKLMFATTPEEEQALANLRLGGAKDKSGPMPAMRDYTPRRFDAAKGELDIDFVIHGDGPASTWAEQAEPGQFLNIGGPRSSMIVPDIFDHYLLIGDETALPAIARRLEELPAGRHAQVVVQIEDAQERQELTSAASVEVTWVLRNEQDLLEVVGGLDLPAEGALWAWVATEAKVSRQVRRVLIDTKGLSESQIKATGYWRLDPNDQDDD